MRLRSLVAMAATSVLSLHAHAEWPSHDVNQDGVIDFVDLLAALQTHDFQIVNRVLADFGGPVTFDTVGDPSAPGADAKAIARWNVVPYQTITGEFQVGVVAFHINGIEKVSFSADGGDWIDVTEMTLNERTETYEYWVTLNAADFDDGPVELRAIAYPNTGVPRLLAGPIDGSNTYRNGNHAMFLYADADQSSPAPFVYCAPWGSDTTGDGTFDNPFHQPAFAASRMSRDQGGASGGVVYLMAGDYSFGPKVHPVPAVSDRWLTFRPAPGVAKEDVRITASGTGGTGAKLIKLEGLSLLGSFSFRQSSSDFIWIDNCDIDQVQLTTAADLVNPAHWGGIYATDLFIENTTHSVRDATFIRNVTVDRVSRSPFGASPMVINSTVTRYDRADSSNHGDVWHWLSRTDTENVIAYGVNVTGFGTQGIFAEVFGDPHPLDNVALVNIHISKDVANTAGSWWETTTNHLLMWNVTLPDQPLRWKLHDFGSVLKNVSIRGCVFERFTFDDPAQFPNVVIRDNHFIDLASYGSFATGDDYTLGEPRFVNPAEGDYSPAMNSPLRNRLTHSLVPIDMMGHQRGAPTAIGARIWAEN
jgi:hypothetical protein